MVSSPDSTSTSRTRDPDSILDHFADLPDPRREQGRIHRLDEIVLIATCAVLCGADNWVQIADYAHSKRDWLATFLELPGGIPSHDTFRRTFCLIDPMAFQGCFSCWMAALMARKGLTPIAPAPSELKPIAIDGKAQRGSARHRRPLGPARRQRLGGRESPDPGTGRHRRQVQRDHGDPRVARAPGPEGGGGDHRRHGVSEGDRRRHHRRAGRVPAGGQGEPAASVRGYRAGVRRGVGSRRTRGGLHRVPDRGGPERSPRDPHLLRDYQPTRDPDARLWVGLAAIVMVISHREIDGVASDEIRYFIGTPKGRRRTTCDGRGAIGGSRSAALGPGRLLP